MVAGSNWSCGSNVYRFGFAGGDVDPAMPEVAQRSDEDHDIVAVVKCVEL